MQNQTVDFIGVGVPKAGTTWIAKMLDAHPDICMSQRKEIDFFETDFSFYMNSYDANYANGIDWYKEHFSHCDKHTRKGEFSVHYIFGENTPEQIKQHFPNVKIIMFLRDPAERLYSHYLHAKSQATHLPSFERIIEEQPDFVEQGFYAKHLQNFLNVFPWDQVYVGIYKDIKEKPEETVESLYAFLEVDSSFKPTKLHKKVNATAPKTTRETQWYFSLRNTIIHSPLGGYWHAHH